VKKANFIEKIKSKVFYVLLSTLFIILLILSSLLTACGTEKFPGYDCYGSSCYPYDSSSDSQNSEPIPNPVTETDIQGSECSDAYCHGVCLSLGLSGGSCGPYGNCLCDENPSDSERCGDGIDNNGDGKVDEGCPCSPEGSTKPCYSGPPETRRVGNCKDGIQKCEGDLEFFTWGDCSGDTTPQNEICSNNLDDDCDYLMDCSDPDCASDRSCIRCTPEICNDGIDNDCDYLIDCSDSDCFNSPFCCVPTAEICNDGRDNDCDYFIDCSDPDCFNSPFCCIPTAEICNDGRDNDCDYYIDCSDSDCSNSPYCCTPTAEICNDGRDNDCDYLIDCSDFDCSNSPYCCVPTAEICNDGRDNDCDYLIDCSDSDCSNSPYCCVPTAEICNDGRDNDCDYLIDCSDSDCSGSPYCCVPTAEICNDGRDNDCDGIIDCNDSDCSSQSICNPCQNGGCECCVPGTSRYCDTPSYCSWGRQDCQPDGRWGYCYEVPAPSSCGGYYYDTSCCISIGACCQDYHDTNGNWNRNESVGNCTGIARQCT